MNFFNTGCKPGYKLIAIEPEQLNNIINNYTDKYYNNQNNSSNQNNSNNQNSSNTQNSSSNQNKEENEKKLKKLKNLYSSLPKYKILANFLNKFIENYDLYSNSQDRSNNNNNNNNNNNVNDNYTDNKNYVKLWDLFMYLKNYKNRTEKDYNNFLLKYLLHKLYSNNNNNNNQYRIGYSFGGNPDASGNDANTSSGTNAINNSIITDTKQTEQQPLSSTTTVEKDKDNMNIAEIMKKEYKDNIKLIDDAFGAINSLEIKENDIIQEFYKRYKKKITNNYHKRYVNYQYNTRRFHYNFNNNNDIDEDISIDPEMIFLHDIRDFETMDDLIQFLLNKLIGNNNSIVNKKMKNSLKDASKYLKSFFGGKSKKYKNKKNITRKCKKL